MKSALFSFLFLLSSYQMVSQLFSSIPLPKEEILHSEVNGEDYVLKITLPFPFEPEKQSYPVLYYLDAFGSSGGINELGKSKMYSNIIDQIIMVGISYNTNPLFYKNLRERDYIHPMDTSDREHQGDKFLSFIKTELIPHMESNYNTDPMDNGLMGFSYGGLFTTWALRTEPDLFQKLIILSPSLSYADNYLLSNKELLKSIESQEKLEVFISYGSLEGDNFIDLGDDLIDLFEENENIKIHHVIFEDEMHGSVWQSATTRAILSLYANKYKQNLYKTYLLYKDEKFNEALSLLLSNFKKYPSLQDENDKYSLACLYALTGDSDNAFAYLATLSGSKKDWHQKFVKDPDLKSLHTDKRWLPMLESIKKK